MKEVHGSVRRERILTLLKERASDSKGGRPTSGSELATLMGVSRQVIVQDIALLRTAHPILATAQGYVYVTAEGKSVRKAFAVRHKVDETADELYTIVDLGGRVIDVIVEHDLYGSLCAELGLGSRRDVDLFLKKLENSRSGALSILADGVHLHTVEADSTEILVEIADALKEKKYLISE